MKFWSPVCLPPRAQIFGVWRSQWRVFRLLKPNIESGEGGQAKKRSLELAIELSVVALGLLALWGGVAGTVRSLIPGPLYTYK